MARAKFPMFKSDGKLAEQYQREWAMQIKAQGRDPYAHFPVAKARGYKLPARRPLTPGKPVRLGLAAFIPLDAERSFTAGASYCQRGATVLRFDRRGVSVIGVDRVAA